MAEMTDTEREALLEDVAQAARAGAAKGARKAGRSGRIRLPWVRIVLAVLVVAAALGLFFGVKALIEDAGSDTRKGESIFSSEDPVEGRDLTLDNQGFLGYTAADFSEVILGDTAHPKKLEVYTVHTTDVATVTDTGLANLVIFSKVQYITFHGTAVYTVNLALVNEYCFVVDNEAMTVTIYIPHASLESINIPAEQIEFSDVERGVLAFGQLKITPEDEAKIQAEAQSRMEKQLLADRVSVDADRFARLAVWEIYQPMVTAVAPGYALDVVFMG